VGVEGGAKCGAGGKKIKEFSLGYDWRCPKVWDLFLSRGGLPKKRCGQVGCSVDRGDRGVRDMGYGRKIKRGYDGIGARGM